MTCEDFTRFWNEQLDDRTIRPPVGSFDEHAANCVACRSRVIAFRAMLAMLAAPTASADLTDRIVASWSDSLVEPRSLPFARRWAWVGGLAAAATLLLAFGISIANRPGKVPIVAKLPPPARSWTTALADATSATLDLARETSAPAARIGQDVLDAGTSSEFVWSRGLDRSPSPSSELMESVLKSANSRVKPISGSARRAFSFLISPSTRPSSGDRREDHSGA